MTDVDIVDTKFYRWLESLPSTPPVRELSAKQKGIIKLEYISPDKTPITKKLVSNKQSTKTTPSSRSVTTPASPPKQVRASSPLREEGIRQRILEANKPTVAKKKVPSRRTTITEESIEKTEECAVCLATDVKESEFLKCGHAICMNCLPQLHKPICPVCQKPLAGPTVTQEILNKIKRAEEEDKRIEERANLAAAIAYQINPHANVYGEVYQRHLK